MNSKKLDHYGKEDDVFMQRALEGIKVLEIGDQLTQFAGKMLADMGAEVIKVEPPSGVESRRVGPFITMNKTLTKVFTFGITTHQKNLSFSILVKNQTEKSTLKYCLSLI